jgi:tetratricopeptide (TPR) repeat protein
MKVFKANFDKFPNVYTTNVGMGRAYSALGDYKKALKHMKAALEQAPDEASKSNVNNLIKRLEENKDVNQ